MSTQKIGFIDGSVPVKPLGDGMFEVLNNVRFYYGPDLPHQYVVIPKGFKTNFASLPFWARWYFTPQGKYSDATVLHDAMVGEFDQTPAPIQWDNDPNNSHTTSWNEAADWFNHAMKLTDTWWLHRMIFYHSVIWHEQLQRWLHKKHT